MTNTSRKCPVCERDDAELLYTNEALHAICCPRCGTYELTWPRGETVLGNLLADDKRRHAHASHAVRSKTSEEKPFRIDDQTAKDLIDFSFPDPEKQMENFLGYLKKEAGDVHFGPIDIKDRNALLGVVGAIDEDALNIIVNGASEAGLLNLSQNGNSVSLTLKAYQDDGKRSRIGFLGE